jgi:SAM-dependent methyltransferase
MKNSYEEHDNQYILKTAFESELNIHTQKTKDAQEKNGGKWDNLYKPGHLHGEWLDSQIEIKDAVDIGCGTGWFVNYLNNNKNFENVIGIEPSKAAIDIAKKIYDNNITYLCGLAEDILPNITLNDPTLFTTFIVLSHLTDDIVIKILKEMDKIAPKGSVFIFNENYGQSFHMNLWHCRTKKWWEENLPNWTITYDERHRPDLRIYKQGLMGVKKV